MYKTADIIRTCIRSHVPCILENPSASMLFLVAPINALLRHPSCVSVTADQCGYGARWRKRTRFACWNCTEPERLGCICHGLSSICEFSGKHHIILKGAGPGGKPWTSLAQEYPARLSYAIANILISSFENNAFSNLQKYCGLAGQ